MTDATIAEPLIRQAKDAQLVAMDDALTAHIRAHWDKSWLWSPIVEKYGFASTGDLLKAEMANRFMYAIRRRVFARENFRAIRSLRKAA